MKSFEEMTILEVRDYINSLPIEEIDKFANEFNELDREDMDDCDVLELLTSSKLYDYLRYRENGNITIDMQTSM